MDFIKLSRMRSLTRKYVNNFISRPCGANRSKVLSQIDMLEEKVLDNKDELEESNLDMEDINNLIKQKTSLESALQSFTDIGSGRDKWNNLRSALDGFYYECKVAELKLSGENVDPSEFREDRRKEEKDEDEGEEESSEEDLPLNIDRAIGG